MSCQTQTVQTLKDAGHRLTPQRLLILSAVRHSAGHITAGEILDAVKESYQYIDTSTVYRTLDMLKRMRLVSETHMGSDQHTYEWIDSEKHHHMVCHRCDRVTSMDDRFIETLADRIMAAYSFEADIEHLAIFGICEECRDADDAASG